MFSSLAERKRILVYVQAVPVYVPGSARKFSDLENTDFKMSHSSKVALGLVSNEKDTEIVAAGFSPILREAVARGATGTFLMPLCDDPWDQLSFFPKEDRFSAILLGENPDWVFSGASLAGLISVKFGYNLQFCSETGQPLEPNCVVLALDSGQEVSNIDVRRIILASADHASPEAVLGNSTLRKLEETKAEILTDSPAEMSSVISRRIRRIIRN